MNRHNRPLTKGFCGLLAAVLSLLSCVVGAREQPQLPPDYASFAADEPAGQGGPHALPEEPNLEDYLRYAALHNGALRAAYYEWDSAVEKLPQAESLPDPRLSYGYYFQEVETRVGAQRQRLGVSQMFPWVGKRALRGDVAAAAAEERRQRFEAEKLRVFYRVTDAYAEYYYLARAIDITRENIELLSYWEKLTQAKYRVATGRHLDVIKAQVELGKLSDRLRTLEDLRAPLVARLNAALNRDRPQMLPWPAALVQTRVADVREEVARELGDTSPELKALDAAVQREEHRIALAKKDFYPDVTFGVQWIETQSQSVADLSDNGTDAVVGMVSINLPVWWKKYGSAVREAEARKQAARERRTDRELTLSSALALALHKFRDAERKVDLYGNGLVPKAKESLAATFTAYESGEADFLDVLDGQRVFLDFHLSYERALADHEQRLAESEMLLGRSLRTVSETPR